MTDVKVDRRTAAQRQAIKAAIRLSVINLQDILKEMQEEPSLLPDPTRFSEATTPLEPYLRRDEESDDTDDV